MQPEGMESLIPILIDDLQLISAAMPDGFKTIFIERERLIARATDLLATNEEFREAAWSTAAIGGKAPIEAGSNFVEWQDFIDSINQNRDFKQFGIESDYFLDISPIEPFRGDSERLLKLFEEALTERKKIVFSASSRGMLERYAAIFRDASLPVNIQYLTGRPQEATHHLLR